MHITMIDRGAVKQENKALLQQSESNPKVMTALYLGISSVLAIGASQLPSTDIAAILMGWEAPSVTPIVIAGTFVTILVTLMQYVLQAGYLLYCVDVHRQEHTGYDRLFDGFAFAGKVVVLAITQLLFIWLWSCLFVIPGVVAAYRYRFAMLNLCQNQELTPTQAMDLSKLQTKGYKVQLLTLDFSFLHWMVLAQLPLIGLYFLAFTPGLSDIALPAIWMQDVVCSAWALVVCCFYVPLYQTSEISYFEIAKSTSQTQNMENNDDLA